MEIHKTINVLHLIATTDTGGAETVVRDLCSMFAGKDVRCSAVIGGGGWLETELERIGARYRVFDYHPFLDFLFLAKIFRILLDDEINVLQCHMSQMNILGSVLGWIMRIPVIMTFHGIIGHFDTPRQILVYRMASWFPTKLVFVSNSLMNAFHHVVPFFYEKSEVIYNGVNLDRFRAVSEMKTAGEPRRFTAVAIGNLLADKDYFTLIDSFRILKQKNDKIGLHIVGEGPERLRIGEYISKLGLSAFVKLLGYRQDIPNILANADLYVICSNYEGFSISTVEAMAAGLPVIATRCGGPEEIIEEGKNGLLVDVGDSSGLAEQMWGLMNDPQRRIAMGQEGRKKASESFSLERMRKKYLALYKSVAFGHKL